MTVNMSLGESADNTPADGGFENEGKGNRYGEN